MDEPVVNEDWEPTPIPEVLHSAYLDGPFRECVSCGEDLDATAMPYQVNKTWKGGEVVFELAVCFKCAAETMAEFSQESMERMQAFFQERYRPTTEPMSCNFCGQRQTSESEYGIGAACRQGLLLRPMVLVCGECNAASQEGLSRKTRDAWGDFVDRNLPGVPRELEPEPIPFTL
jgi:hypothetical protein